jgi:hypothetical protein
VFPTPQICAIVSDPVLDPCRASVDASNAESPGPADPLTLQGLSVNRRIELSRALGNFCRKAAKLISWRMARLYVSDGKPTAYGGSVAVFDG